MLYLAKDIQKFYYIYIVVKVMRISIFDVSEYKGINNSKKNLYNLYIITITI